MAEVYRIDARVAHDSCAIGPQDVSALSCASEPTSYLGQELGIQVKMVTSGQPFDAAYGTRRVTDTRTLIRTIPNTSTSNIDHRTFCEPERLDPWIW